MREEAAVAEARIQVLSGPQAGREVVFRDSLILGRSRAAGVVLPHPTVSREHARIFHREGRWNLVDLKSRNGTRLRGKLVTLAELREGDEILLGEVRLRFFLGPEEEGKESSREGGGLPAREEGVPPPRPLPAGPPGARRLGAGLEAKSGKVRSGGGSLLGEDLSQWSGLARFLALLLALFLAGALFYLAFTWVS